MDRCDFSVNSGMRATGAAFPRTGAQRFGDDLLDGPCAAPAFGAAPEASVNLLGRTRQVVRCGDGRADVVIGQYVAGTNDHKNWRARLRCADTDIGPSREAQRENRLFQAIPNWRNSEAV